jgi:uncharacterized protein (TIGR02246 family)
MANVSASLASSSDEQAIRSVVREYGASWNRHDMAALAQLFTDDAHWINIVGMHWPDKSAVVTGHEAFHRTFFKATDIELADIEIRPIAADVAVAVVLLKVGSFTPPDGVHRPKSENRLSLMLSRRDGRWLIVHGHNTVIDPAAQPFNPVTLAGPTGGERPRSRL